MGERKEILKNGLNPKKPKRSFRKRLRSITKKQIATVSIVLFAIACLIVRHDN